MRNIAWALSLLALVPQHAARGQETKEPGCVKITYVSSADNTGQQAVFFAPENPEGAPLLVALHTWGGDYRQTYHDTCARWCAEHGWAYIHPNFRGPNIRPEATGSELAVQDIADAVEYAAKTAGIDRSSVYLVGTSGGGYMALLMAGRRPDLWAAVSAWAAISDLNAWYFETLKAGRNYHKDIAASCGGAPGDSPEVDAEYVKRSPLTHLPNASGLRLHINAGIQDGHSGSVPVSHSLRAFNSVAAPDDRLTEEEIGFFVEKADVPPGLENALEMPEYGNKPPLFRRTSGRVSITIFKGGHELVPEAAMAWLQSIHEGEK